MVWISVNLALLPIREETWLKCPSCFMTGMRPISVGPCWLCPSLSSSHLGHVPLLATPHQPHAARGVLYPDPFCLPAGGPLPADVAVLVPFQADDHPLILLDRRGGLLHHRLQAVVWL